MKESTTINTLIGIGILASILTGIGEYLLHFLPDGPPGEISMLEHVALDRASRGHFFSVVGVPLYVAGYYGLKEFFKKSNATLANVLFVLGTLAFFIGGIWISSRYFGAEVLQRTQGTPDHDFFYESYEKHYQVLVWALRIIVLFFSPIILLIIVISSLFWFKPLGVHIAPIAMNVTHFIFFSVMLWQINRVTKPS